MILSDNKEAQRKSSTANITDSLPYAERQAVLFALSPISREIQHFESDFTKLETSVRSAFNSAIPETLKRTKEFAGQGGVNSLMKTILLFESENVLGSQLIHEDVIKAKLSSLIAGKKNCRGAFITQDSSQESLVRVVNYLTNIYLQIHPISAENLKILPPSESRDSSQRIIEHRRNIESAIVLYLRTTSNEFKVMKNTGLPYTVGEIEQMLEEIKENDPIELLNPPQDFSLAEYLQKQYQNKIENFYTVRNRATRRVQQMLQEAPDDEDLLHDDLY